MAVVLPLTFVVKVALQQRHVRTTLLLGEADGGDVSMLLCPDRVVGGAND